MTTLKGEYYKIAKTTAVDLLGLERWNYIDLQNSNQKIRIVIAYQRFLSKQIENTIYIQQFCYQKRKGRVICPRKVFAQDIT